MIYKEILDGDKTIICTEKCDIFLCDGSGKQAEKLINEESFEILPYSPVTPKKLKKLIILLSTACNLRCRYCYLSYGKHPGEAVIQNINVENVKKALNLIIEKYPEGIEFIQFFGGEPLMAFKEMQEIYEYLGMFFESKGLLRPALGVVTNGLRINDEVIDFFNRSNMAVTVSIDGDKSVHDNVRKKISKGSAYTELVEIVMRYKDKITFPLFYEMTLNREHILNYQKGSMRNWLESIKKVGFTRGIIGVVEYSMDPSLNFREEDIPIIEEIYKEYVEYYFEELSKEETTFYNLDICRIIGMIVKKDLKLYSCNTGISQLTLSTNGTLYPCPKFATVDMRIGKVEDAEFDQSEIRKIIEKDDRKMCRECWMKQMCKSYCYSLEYRKEFNREQVPIRCIHLDNMISNVIREMIRRKNCENFSSIVKKAMTVLAMQKV